MLSKSYLARTSGICESPSQPSRSSPSARARPRILRQRRPGQRSLQSERLRERDHRVLARQNGFLHCTTGVADDEEFGASRGLRALQQQVGSGGTGSPDRNRLDEGRSRAYMYLGSFRRLKSALRSPSTILATQWLQQPFPTTTITERQNRSC